VWFVPEKLRRCVPVCRMSSYKNIGGVHLVQTSSGPLYAWTRMGLGKPMDPED